jgi:uncharacterized protein
MPRPPGVELERYVDATQCAYAEIELARDFTLDALPRLREAGARERTVIQMRLRFLRMAQNFGAVTPKDGNCAIDGALHGQLELECQRCMRPLLVPMQETFKVVIVADEAALAQEYMDYEPILVDPTRLDLQWLAEEQGLLGLPLVARHEPGQCEAAAELSQQDAGTQRPFGNLRDLMRDR